MRAAIALGVGAEPARADDDAWWRRLRVGLMRCIGGTVHVGGSAAGCHQGQSPGYNAKYEPLQGHSRSPNPCAAIVNGRPFRQFRQPLGSTTTFPSRADMAREGHK